MSDHRVHQACVQTQCGLKPNLKRTSNPNIKEAVNSQLFPVEVYPLVARCYAVQFFNNVVNLAYTQTVIRELEGFIGYHTEEPTQPPPRELTALYCSVRSMAQYLDLLTCKLCLMRRGRVEKKRVDETNLAVTDGEKLEVTQELREIGIIALPGQTIVEFWKAVQEELKALQAIQEGDVTSAYPNSSYFGSPRSSYPSGSYPTGSNRSNYTGFASGSRSSQHSYRTTYSDSSKSNKSGSYGSPRSSYPTGSYPTGSGSYPTGSGSYPTRSGTNPGSSGSRVRLSGFAGGSGSSQHPDGTTYSDSSDNDSKGGGSGDYGSYASTRAIAGVEKKEKICRWC
eukprot:GEMP01033191.1.p1 GENE.GEMP01033191.1~~GEMP01033191.1.p1  ORF type:complete len:339 (+),score=28.68 GEMP01033191.1:444-1460(+)